ncbi:MAG TPA: DUF302 domain-containing protein [Gemmataceae bacterium]|jgi:uncharacterized protein (DUF302 family)|nr:DUF302 domain-containing protein [Gemmataceae bacterium]
MEITTAIPSRLQLLVCTGILFALTLGGIVAVGTLAFQRPGGNSMSTSRFTVDHIQITTDKPFEEVAAAFEKQLGLFNPEVYQSLAAGGDVEEAKAKTEAMAGPSGFMLFGTNDHGSLLRIAGQKRKAIQYVVGNPLFALQMTQHDIRASLYAPLRVLLYENEEGKTCVEYDRPSSLFGQFGDDRVTPAATMLDSKMEALVTAAIR